MARHPGARATGAVSARVGYGPVVACIQPVKGPALVDGADNVNDPIHSRIVLGFPLRCRYVLDFALDGHRPERTMQIKRVSKSIKQSRIRQKPECISPESIAAKRRPRNGRSLTLGSLLLVAAVLSICAFALTQKGAGYAAQRKSASGLSKSAPSEPALPSHNVTPEEHVLSGKTQFSQFPPHTEAEQELEKMLRGKDEDVDLALASWLIAADIPQFRDMTRESYFKELDAMTKQVRQDMARMEKIAVSRGKNPSDPDTRCGIFCNAIINLRFAYAEEFRQQPLTPLQKKALHGNANNTFLAGLLRTRRGSCVSMPLIYLVIGRRLGFPVHLVALGDHYFIRWEEPGYRLNIEPTKVDKVWVTDDDSAYVESLGLTRDQLKGSDLRNLSNREVVGQLFFERSGYWAMTPAPSRTRSWMDLSRARHLAPDDPEIARTHQGIFGHYGIQPEDTLVSLKQKAHEGK